MNKLTLSCLLLLLIPAILWAETNVSSPANLLNGNQREYYQRVFKYVMEHYNDDKPYEWKSGAEKGSIRVSKLYTSKSKSLCRNFSESFVVNGEAGKYEGVACRRDDNKGWCRLTYNGARTCALEAPQSITDKVIEDTESVIEGGDELIRKTQNWWNR